MSSIRSSREARPATAPATKQDLATRRRWLAVAVLAVAQFMVFLDETVVNVALPSIKTSLGFSQPSLAWVINAYVLLFGGLILVGGRAADLAGRRRIFLVGTAVFGIASLLDGLATSRACSSVPAPCKASAPHWPPRPRCPWSPTCSPPGRNAPRR
jgi:MFS family permease